jgi:hypothetical protein
LTVHRYPTPALLADGVRAGFGLAATIGPLLFLEVALPLGVVLGVLGVIFLAFAIRVAARSLSSVELSKRGIAIRGPMGRALEWRQLRQLKLAHYAPPRRRSEGWFQLSLAGDGPVLLRLESTIDGFDAILAEALEAARANGIDLDPATGGNLAALGHSPAWPRAVG